LDTDGDTVQVNEDGSIKDGMQAKAVSSFLPFKTLFWLNLDQKEEIVNCLAE